MTRAKLVVRQWLPVAAVATVLCLLVYVTAQQLLRHAADDPQIQVAEDAAAALARGESPASVLPAGWIDIAASVAPFTMVLDEKGGVVVTSGLLHRAVPSFPAGVLEFARAHGEHRVTWQPERGVRIASVVIPLGGDKLGFVVTGRSLRESERRTAQFGTLALLGWLAALVISLAVTAAAEAMLPIRGGP